MRLPSGLVSLLAVLVTTSLATPGRTQSSFDPAHVVVLRVGDGAGALSNASTAVFLDSFNRTTPDQAASAFTVALPTTGAGQLTMSGTATSEGQITRSGDGLSIIVPGYQTVPGFASVAGSSTTGGTPVPRTVGAVSATGAVTNLGTTTNFSGNNIRGAYSDGTSTWAVGATSGVVLVPGTEVVSATSANNRVVNSFNGNLYFSTGAGTRGVYQVGTSGRPTAPGTASELLIGTGGTSSPYGFAISPSGTTAYVADDRATGSGGGIQKWTFDGTAWSLAGTFTALSGTNGARGLAVDFGGANPVLFATTVDNRLVTLTDTGNFAAAAITLATAAPNTVYRGVAFAPVPEPATAFGLAAAGLGLGGLLCRRVRRRR
jgi:hypothetical protein